MDKKKIKSLMAQLHQEIHGSGGEEMQEGDDRPDSPAEESSENSHPNKMGKIQNLGTRAFEGKDADNGGSNGVNDLFGAPEEGEGKVTDNAKKKKLSIVALSLKKKYNR